MNDDLIILAIYINVNGMSRTRSEQNIKNLMEYYNDLYKNVDKKIKIYYLPSNETKVECVYPPPSIMCNNGIIENELLKIYKLLLNSKDFEAKELLLNIERKMKLNKLYNGSKNNK